MRRLVTKSLPWSSIEPHYSSVNVRLGNVGHALLLREVVAEKTVGIFVRTSLPVMVGSSKIDGGSGILFQSLDLVLFRAVVQGQVRRSRTGISWNMTWTASRKA